MKTKAVLLSTLTFLLLGCDSGGNSGTEPPSIGNAMVGAEFLQLGSLDLDTETGRSISTSALASFETFAEPMPVRAIELINTVNRLPNKAQCHTFLVEENTENVDFTDEQVKAYTELLGMWADTKSVYGVSAGSPIVISTPAGDWPELIMDGNGGYHTGREEYQPGTIETGSSLTIPGADFPAMTVDELPTVDAIRGLLASASPIHTLSSGDMVTWQANESTNGKFVSIVISVGESTFSSENDTDRTKFVSKSILQCIAPDIGEFQVPSELAELLSAGDLSVGVVEIKRKAFGMKQQGDALLLMFAKADAIIED